MILHAGWEQQQTTTTTMTTTNELKLRHSFSTNEYPGSGTPSMTRKAASTREERNAQNNIAASLLRAGAWVTQGANQSNVGCSDLLYCRRVKLVASIIVQKAVTL
jgi:hypothetical protein